MKRTIVQEIMSQHKIALYMGSHGNGYCSLMRFYPSLSYETKAYLN